MPVIEHQWHAPLLRLQGIELDTLSINSYHSDNLQLGQQSGSRPKHLRCIVSIDSVSAGSLTPTTAMQMTEKQIVWVGMLAMQTAGRRHQQTAAQIINHYRGQHQKVETSGSVGESVNVLSLA